MKIYQEIASILEAIANCERSGNSDWVGRHRATLETIERVLPSGGGFDSGSFIDIDRSTPNKIALNTSYHHMNEAGHYDGWTNHRVIITPSLARGFELRITGRDRNQIKEYIAETFWHALTADYTEINTEETNEKTS